MRGLWAGLALMMVPAVVAAQGGGMGGGMGGDRGRDMGAMGGGRGRGGPPPGMGGAPRASRPVKREAFDRAVETMFRAADTDRDGIVTLTELRAVLEAKRDAAIRARFDKVDANGNRQVDFAEFLAWQRSLGSAAMSEGPESAVGGPVAESLPPPLGDDREARILAGLVEPLSATLLVTANVNYDQGVSLDELLAYEGKRFETADADRDGSLSAEEQRALLPRGRGRALGGGREDEAAGGAAGAAEGAVGDGDEGAGAGAGGKGPPPRR